MCVVRMCVNNRCDMNMCTTRGAFMPPYTATNIKELKRTTKRARMGRFGSGVSECVCVCAEAGGRQRGMWKE